jgi:8-oxo-dGTP diphosphatase
MAPVTEEPSIDGLRIRPAARALVVDPDDRVLLVRFEFPTGTRWALPGGGIETGESPEEAIRRELVEEVGLHHAAIGPHIWTRLHVIPFLSGHWDGQREVIHLVRTPAFDPAPALSWEELAAEYVFELRWWTIDEIGRADATFAPRALHTLLGPVLAGELPVQPIDTGV